MEELKTLEDAKIFLNNIPEDCRRNLMIVMKEELEMLKKYKIIVDKRLRRSSSPESTCSVNSETLIHQTLESIFKENKVEGTIINQDLLDKIDNQNLNPKEAEDVITLLSQKCNSGGGRKETTLNQAGMITGEVYYDYTFMLTPSEIDYTRYKQYKTFKEVLDNL